MKALLVNLLIVLALGLCALNAYQWHREAQLRKRLDAHALDLQRKDSEIRSLRENLAAQESEVQRLAGIREGLDALIQSNRTEIARLRQESAALQREAQEQTAAAAQLEQYRDAFEKANENLRRQNEIIASQNQRLKEIADGRNQIVEQFNKLAQDYKALGDDYSKVLGMYTNLVAQVEAANARNSR